MLEGHGQHITKAVFGVGMVEQKWRIVSIGQLQIAKHVDNAHHTRRREKYQSSVSYNSVILLLPLFDRRGATIMSLYRITSHRRQRKTTSLGLTQFIWTMELYGETGHPEVLLIWQLHLRQTTFV